MREPLLPIAAYQADVRDGERWAGHPTQPHGWFSVTHVAYRMASLPVDARLWFLQTLPASVLPDASRRPTQVDHDAPPPAHAFVVAAEQLRVAAEDMERDGCFEMAFTTVSSAARIVARHGAGAALCASVHLARIARQLGEVRTAEEMYESVAEEAAQRGFPCVAGYALAGLGNLAIMRGNRPAQLRYFTAALQAAQRDTPLEAAARWGLMNHALAVESLADALIHGWRAFDLSRADEERAGILSNLASVAHQSHFPDAALAGYEGALRMAKPLRLWLSIAAAAAEAAGSYRRENLLLLLEEEGRRRSGPVLPFEKAQWLLGLARGWAFAGSANAAGHFAREARGLAQSHEFHELVFRSDEILDRIESETVTAWSPDASVQDAATLPEAAQAGLARLCAVAG